MEYSIEAYVDTLLVEKGISNVSDEVMQQLRSDLVERAEDMVNASILAKMPEDALEEFESMLDEGSDEEVKLFCKKHIDNLDEVIAEGLINLRKAYLTGIAQ